MGNYNAAAFGAMFAIIALGLSLVALSYSMEGGAVGPAGPQGEQGIQGLPGVNGTDGLNGAQGLQGEIGPQGIPGVNGTNGLDFNQTGTTFLFNGTQGIQGEKGDKGDTGDQGLQGETGATGAQGPAGMAGYTIMAACWTNSATKTNIGTSYVDVYTASTLYQYVNFTGYTQYRVIYWVNKIGSGTQSWQLTLSNSTAFATVNDAGGAGAKILDSGWITPMGLSGELSFRPQGKSTTAGDDPVFYGCEVLLK